MGLNNDWLMPNWGIYGLGEVMSEMEVTKNLHIVSAFSAIHSIWHRQAELNRTKITVHIDDNLPANIAINGIKVQHCLNNLVSNAVQHTKDGHIRLLATKLSKNGKEWLLLAVEDNGTGIGEDYISNLFNQPLSSKPRNYGYIETSLPMTNKLIKEMGGKIIIKSKIAKGSLFALILPMVENSPSNMQNTINKTGRQEMPGVEFLNILVVDDFTLNQLTIKTLLDEHKGNIYSAIHGYEALDILNSNPVDVVLMDIHMPVLDGIETTMRIREAESEWNNVPIYAMTADPQYQHADLCIKIGMNGALAKPVRRDTLIDLLNEAVLINRPGLVKKYHV